MGGLSEPSERVRAYLDPDETRTGGRDDEPAARAADRPARSRWRPSLPALRGGRGTRRGPKPEITDDVSDADRTPRSTRPGQATRVSRRRIMVRRGVVVGLLIVCVLLLTAFFREGEDGFLHSVKGTVTDIVSPVQDVGAAAVKPVRDAWNWFADLRDARRERDHLRTENEQLRTQMSQNQQTAEDAAKLKEQLDAQLFLKTEGPGGYQVKTATVISRPPFEATRRARINLGRQDGLTVNSLVFVPASTGAGQRTFGAVVGLVTRVDATGSRVTFITDPTTAVAARIQGTTVPLGLLKATPTGQLLLTGVPAKVAVADRMNVVTLGTGTSSLPSPYPPGLLIGTVSDVGNAEPSGAQTVQVTPFRDPVDLDTLTILVPQSPEARRRAGIGG